MNKKVLKVADVNYAQIDAELAALEPPTVTLQEVLERLDERVREMQSQGVTGGSDGGADAGGVEVARD